MVRTEIVCDGCGLKGDSMDGARMAWFLRNGLKRLGWAVGLPSSVDLCARCWPGKPPTAGSQQDGEGA